MTTTVQDIIVAALGRLGRPHHNPASVAHHFTAALSGVLPAESLQGLTLSSPVPVFGYDDALTSIFTIFASSFVGGQVTPQMMQDNMQARAMLGAL